MSLRPYTIHKCFDQRKLLAYLDAEPRGEEVVVKSFLPKPEFLEMLGEAAEKLGAARPEKCKCRFRVGDELAKYYLVNGEVSRIIVDWKYNPYTLEYFAVFGPNLVYGGSQEGADSFRASYAKKTPRVMTLERANLERAYVDQKQDEIDRIEAYGALSREVISGLVTTYWPNLPDPFGVGRPFILNHHDMRTCPGITRLHLSLPFSAGEEAA
jgi:hypothetical protein